MLSNWLTPNEVESSIILPFAHKPSSSRSSGGREGSGGAFTFASATPASSRPQECPSFDLDPSSVVEAHRSAVQAEECRKKGQLIEAMQKHMEASSHFLDAAERLNDVNGVTGAALLLLSDGHVRQAHTLQQILRNDERSSLDPSKPRGDGKGTSSKSAGNRSGAGGAAGGGAANPEGSMYASAIAPERGWTSQVDDMMSLERCLQAIGSQPMFSSGTYQKPGAIGGNPSARYLSSTLGDSFFLVSNRHAANREGAASVVWEGGSMMSSTSKAGSGPLQQQQQQKKQNDGHITGGMSDRPPKPRSGPGGDAGRRDGLRGSRTSALAYGNPSTTGDGGGAPAGRDPSSVGPSPPPSMATSSSSSSHVPRRGGGSGSASGRLSSSTESPPSSETAGGGFLDGVESVQQGEVMRLLSCMKTLGDENAALIKQVEDGTRIRQENEKLKKEMMEFKELYTVRFKQLRAALEEFRQKYPHEMNPTNHLSSSVDKARIKNLEAEVESLYTRLNREREAGKKKDAMIRKYEQWYKTLKASAQSKSKANAAARQAAATSGTGGGTSGDGSSATSGQSLPPRSTRSGSAPSAVSGGGMPRQVVEQQQQQQQYRR